LIDTGRIEALAAAARPLEPDAGARAALMKAVAAHAERFLESLPERSTYHGSSGGVPPVFVEEPGTIERALAHVAEHIEEALAALAEAVGALEAE
jgi:hypothetical protein